MENLDENAFSEYSTLSIGSGQFTTMLTKKFENRKKWIAPNAKEIISFISGTVIEINVKENQKVKRGETILILEAMKMQNNVLSPIDGEIESIHVKPGESIAKGVLMIVIK